MIYHNLKDISKEGSSLIACIDKTTLITCPHCKTATYLPGEIFMPGALIGKPADVVRDTLGSLICVEYSDENKPNTPEHFTCEYCNRPFIVEATITYKTTAEAPEKDFSTDTTSLI